ncbi:carbohydrate esterase family 16 protein [Piloderma croceum F 1598]|uniref:Carbohydrate esterase family 16 protein n=1 Tax=Piloderma croceum (strain F 1598) TaxID=765440 RepID=A0A0C3FN15_PILCF|nr:carbohydrate esterase family 16 protein [Piloderma croceum F 1598]
MAIFLNQSNQLDSASTLYTIFFGINDYEDSLSNKVSDPLLLTGINYVAVTADGDHLPEAAQVIINQITILSSPPTNGRNFLVTDVYGRGVHTPDGDAYVQSIFDGLNDLHTGTPSLNVAFADFARIWDGVLGDDPGYKAFGYTNSSSCLTGDQGTVGECDDPKHYFYWIEGHPSNETMRIMADYVEEVLLLCTVS